MEKRGMLRKHPPACNLVFCDQSNRLRGLAGCEVQGSWVVVCDP